MKKILYSKTIRHSQITLIGTLINGGFGALFYIFAARFLGPADFGLMVVAILMLTLVTDVTDFGLNTGVVRFSSIYWEKNKETAFKFIRVALEFKLVFSVLVVIIGWFLSPTISVLIFKKSYLATSLLIAFVGVLGLQMYSLSLSVFQSFQRYFVWSGLQVSTNFLRILLLATLFLVGKINLIYALVVYISMPFLGFILSTIFLPKELFKIEGEKKVFLELFHFSKWVALSTLLAAFSSRLDTFISARFVSSVDLGYYAAASQLVAVVPQIVGALGTVIAPKMAGMSNVREFLIYFKKTQLLVTGLALLGLLSAPIVSYLIPLLYGREFSTTVPQIFVILLLAMIIFLISTPIHMAIFYYFGNSKLFTFISGIHLLVVALSGMFLIPGLGIYGAALSVLFATLVDFLLSVLWLFKEIKKNG